MKIAVAQINPVVGSFENNISKIVSFAEKAKKGGCDLVVFPELAVTGYPPRDLLERDDFVDANLNWLQTLVGSISGIGVVAGYADRNTEGAGNPVFNSAALFEDGEILHRVNKRLLPEYDVFDERRYFEPGRRCDVFEYKGCRLGITICEDAWNDKDIIKKSVYDMDPVTRLRENGAELLVNISASPFNKGKNRFRANMLGGIAKKHGMTVVYANQVGGNDSLVFDGISSVFTENGNIAARARDFEEDLIFFDTERTEGDIREIAEDDVEATLKALVLGVRDYVTKCGFSKVVIGLSGGIDSALTAFIAVKALGPENVSTVFMPSKYTSMDNFEDTEALAANLGVPCEIIPIDSIFQSFLAASPEFEEKAQGVTEQNIQARVRGTLLMAFSNKKGALVLTTGNKSELAVGYCTLYGDMNGGLAVISDVPKTVVWEMSRFINREKEIIPVRIIEKAPSAELKPDQTDQDDLPPYDILDRILEEYVEKLKSRDEMIAMGFDEGVVDDIIRRITVNEYKRHQAAPGLKVTTKAFGYGRRYPIAQRFRG